MSGSRRAPLGAHVRAPLWALVRALPALTGAFGPAAFAQDDVIVYSARADSVAVTIYPGDLALITETRTVTLPASPATLVIQDVVDTLLPQSAALADLDRPLDESNFDFNQLSPESLLRHAVGTTVTLMRTNPATGVVSYLPATVLAVGEGVVLETEDGNEALYCSGLPEGIVFDAIPDDLYATPQLSVKLAGGAPGERTFRVSYLAHGFDWSADYVAELDSDGDRMDLAGWATVTNGSGRAFSQAELNLVAGRLNILYADDGGSRADRNPQQRSVTERRILEEETAAVEAALLTGCFESEPPAELNPGFRDRLFESPMSAMPDEAIIVTGARIVRETFGDYHLYRLPWRTDLGARQTKQVLFLDQRDAGIERVYRFYVSGMNGRVAGRGATGSSPDSSRAPLASPRVLFLADNTSAAGLGEPLPSGRVRFFEPSGEDRIYTGEAAIADRPVGAEIEMEIGGALDVLIEYRSVTREGALTTLEADVLAMNDKGVPIELEVMHLADQDYIDLAVEQSSRPFDRVGDYFVWRFELPPGSERLTYTLSGREIE